MANNLPYDSSGESYYEGDFDPEFDTLDIHIAARKRLQQQLEKVILEETRENEANLADQVFILATDSDFVISKCQLNPDNTPHIAYGLFRGLLKYLQTVYDCDDGDLEEVFGAFWEDYYVDSKDEDQW